MGFAFDNTELSVFFFIDVGCMFISELEARKEVRNQKYWSTTAMAQSMHIHLRSLLKDDLPGCSYSKLFFALGYSRETCVQSSKDSTYVSISTIPLLILIHNTLTYTAVVALGTLRAITRDVARVTARVARLVGSSSEAGEVTSSLCAVAAEVTNLTTLKKFHGVVSYTKTILTM